MYIFDFFKNLFKKSNVGILIWLILNTALIAFLFSNGFQVVEGIFLGLLIYLVSLTIALSPIGEWLSVVSVTKREKELNSNIGQGLYVVENTAIDGIIILQNESGEIYSSTPASSPKKIFDSLCDYIMSR